MEDFYQDGFDVGYGRGIPIGHDIPRTDGERYSYREGFEDGARRRKIREELEREEP